jgi:PAS domain S-box-containing protein
MSMRQPLRILSVEDDPKDTELIRDLLETEGIVCEVTRVDTQADFLGSVKQGGIDLILADYSLPSFDGISALKFAMKACPDVPFIFVSGTLGEEVAIEALKIGATDYVLKTSLSRLAPSILRALREATQKAERKRVEESLRQSETYLAEAQRLSRTGSFGWNVLSGEIYWSEETHNIFESDRAVKPTLELVFRRIHPDDRALVQQIIDQASEARANLDFEHRLLMPDGSVKHLHVLAHALKPSSRSLEYVGAVTDVTGRKRTEETLREREAYLAESQRLAQTGSCAIDGTSREILYWSEEMFRLFGFDPQQGLPMWDQWLQRIHPEDRDKFRMAGDRTFLEKVHCDVEFRTVKPDGTVKHIHGIGHPVLSPSSGELVQVVGTMVDVTERKRAEEARERLRQLEADLAHISRVNMMGHLTASLAHEINQPIGAAVANAEACLQFLDRDQPDVAEAREAAFEMARDARRAAAIIDRVRSLYGKGSSQKEIVDVNEVILEMALMLHNQASRYSVMMRTELAEKLPKVVADRVQLQQVLMNLMLNGIEAMRDTTGELSIKSHLAEKGQLQISVIDTGVGLPAGNADQIFNAFFTTKSQGTGLGLAITRSIVESHGGRVWATANPGRGATFQFTLPSTLAVAA